MARKLILFCGIATVLVTSPPSAQADDTDSDSIMRPVFDYDYDYELE